MNEHDKGVVSQEGMNRRKFLRLTGATAAMLGVFPTVFQFAKAQTPTADTLVQGKNATLIVHGQRPVILETPLRLLREHKLTPKSIMYIRNNQELPGANTTEPFSATDWEIDVGGLVRTPTKLKLSELRRLEATEVEMVLQCSGNGRGFMAQFARASGSQWRHGAMSNVRWKGALLSRALRGLEIDPRAKYLTTLGADQPTAANATDMEKSVLLADVFATAILAYEMNGEPIPAVHGGPVRLILPGYFGVNNTKWLNVIRFDATESTESHQIPRYRNPNNPIAPGSQFTFTFDNSRPNWRQNVKAVIFTPLEGETVKRMFEVTGVAWNDGMAPITSVEVSSDGGKTWKQALVEKPSGPYAWHHWRTTVILRGGEGEVMVRAIDNLGRSMPMDGSLSWNPNGYEWNVVDRVKVKVG